MTERPVAIEMPPRRPIHDVLRTGPAMPPDWPYVSTEIAWAALVARITYRPNVRLFVSTGPTLIVEMHVTDTYTGNPATVTHTHQLPPHLDPAAYPGRALYEIRNRLHRVETHEADEWLRIDGEMPFDPHKVTR